VQFRVLGPLELVDEERPLALGGGRQRTLLLALLLHANEVVSSDRLIEALWGERPPASAAKLVQGFVSRLRRLLGDGRLETCAPGYLLRVEPGELDVDRFEALLAEAQQEPPARAAELLREALLLWRGPPLPELRYAEIAQPELARLEALRHVALERRFEADLALGRHSELLPDLEGAVAAEPLRERLRGQLMLALYRSGRQADALALYAETRRVLVEELGIEPSTALKELERRILGHDPALELQPPAQLPAPTRAEGDRPPGNLPMASTSFLGRRRELGEIVKLIVRDDVRLLTLTGPGGSGKTRLAAEAAAELAGRYRDGVWWVPLTPLRKADLVTAAAAQTLGISGDLASAIADRSLLLVFDNFEQVVDAAAEVACLLPACPRLKLLVTSREPLHVAGEQQYPVPPLRPDESVELFVARARALQPDLEVNGAVPEICRRLDDLPLALELAAARTAAMSPAQILERLDQRLPLLTGGPRDAPERQRTLRGAITWSYGLLTAAERLIFARLSVFSGGCTLEAAEHVTEADLDTLQSLVAKNLLRHARERYSMLETIREYASERLQQSPEAEKYPLRQAQHFLAFAEQTEPKLRWSGSAAEWLDRLEADHDNFRGAIEHFTATGDGHRALRLAGALSRFWIMKGHLAEGRHRLESALTGETQPTPARAKALNGLAVMTLGVDAACALQRAEEAFSLNRELGEAWGTGYSAFLAGQAANLLENTAAAQQFLSESLRQFREVGDDHYILLATDGLAGVYDDLGDTAHARPLHEENLRRARAQANRRIVALSLDQLASYARDEGRVEDALAMLRESLGILTDLGDSLGIGENLARFARALAVAGRPETAAQLLSSSEALYNETGGGVLSWVAKMNNETLVAIRSQIGDEALAEASNQGRALTIGESVALALASSAGPTPPAESDGNQSALGRHQLRHP
jgi:predicted ATPase/DNA-binding SARP family transcriptional activator